MSVELQANGPYQIAQVPQNGQKRQMPPKPDFEQFLAWCGKQSATPLSNQAKQALKALWPKIAAQPLDANGNFNVAPIKSRLDAILKPAPPTPGLTTPLRSTDDAVSITFLKTLPADFKAKVSCIRTQILSDPTHKAAIFQKQCMGKESELAALCGNLAQLAEKFPPDEALFKISDLIDRLASDQIEVSDISALNRLASGIESDGTRPMSDEVLRQKVGQLIQADPAGLSQLRYELRMGEMAIDSRAQVQQFARSSTIFPPVSHADGTRSAQAKVDIVTAKTNIRTVATGNWDKAAVDAQIKELQTWVDARNKGHADFANKPILLVMPYASAAPGNADYDRLLRWCAQNEVHVRHSDSPSDYEIPNLAGMSRALLVDPERQRALRDQLLLGKSNEDLKRFGDHLGFQIADVRWQIDRLKGAFPQADRPASQTERLQQLETLLANACEAHRAVEDKLGYKLPISPKPVSEQDISAYRRMIDLGETADTGWEGLESLRQDLSKVGESLIRNGQDLIDTPNQVKALAQGVYQEAVELITDPNAKWEETQANAKALAQFINQICKDETMRNELVNKGVDYLKQVLTDPDTYLDFCGDLASELSGSGIANKIETALDNLELFKKLGAKPEAIKKLKDKIEHERREHGLSDVDSPDHKPDTIAEPDSKPNPKPSADGPEKSETSVAEPKISENLQTFYLSQVDSNFSIEVLEKQIPGLEADYATMVTDLRDPNFTGDKVVLNAKRQALGRQISELKYIRDNKDELIADVKRDIKALFRQNADIGDGSTRDAVVWELETHVDVKGANHVKKAEDMVDSLKYYLKVFQLGDPTKNKQNIELMQKLILDLEEALQTKEIYQPTPGNLDLEGKRKLVTKLNDMLLHLQQIDPAKITDKHVTMTNAILAKLRELGERP